MATGNWHKNLVKFGRVVFELCERTDRQTDTHHNTLQPSQDKVTISAQCFVIKRSKSSARATVWQLNKYRVRRKFSAK